MKREIKFRGRVNRPQEFGMSIKGIGDWVYGYYYSECECAYIFEDRQSEEGLFARNIPFIEVDPDTIGQFTGLKDKNGVEIYEGDIVVIPGAYPFFMGDKPNYLGVVEWIYSQWQYVYQLHKDSTANGISVGINVGLNDDGIADGCNTDFEIIGNIHDNLDLLTD